MGDEDINLKLPVDKTPEAYEKLLPEYSFLSAVLVRGTFFWILSVEFRSFGLLSCSKIFKISFFF